MISPACAHLRQALKGNVPERRLGEQLQKDLHNIGLKYIAHWHPGQKCMQGGEGRPYEVSPLAGGQHKEAQLMDQAELLVQGVLQLLCLRLLRTVITQYSESGQ